MPAAAMVAAAVISAYGANKAAKTNKEAAESASKQGTTQQQTLDPRMQTLLYGDGTRQLRQGVTPIYDTSRTGQYGPISGSGALINPESDYVTNNGILGRVQGLLDDPQNPGLQQFGNASDTYVGQNGLQDLNNMRASANALMGAWQYTPHVQVGDIQAPDQNKINLSDSYKDFVYGDPGSNPFLTGGIQKGINQSKNAFTDMQTDYTKNLTQNILPSIRSGAIMSGQFGGNRQGLAEGKALDDYQTNMTRAMERFGQGNTDSAIAAQAGAYDTDRNRALAATQGLGAQQYNTAAQNTENQLRQQQINGQFTLQNNQQRNAAIAAGIGANSGLLDQAYRMAGNQDSYNVNRTGQIAGMISPFTGLGGSTTMTQPMYSNGGANVLGGITTGLGIYNAFKNTNWGGTPGSNYDANSVNSDTWTPRG